MNFYPAPNFTRAGSSGDRLAEITMCDPGTGLSAKRGTGEHRPVSDLVDADLLAFGVTCRDSREWVECAPRRRVARPGRRPSCPCPANGLYRRRAHDWDPGFRMRGSLSRIKHAGAARSPSLFLTRRLASFLSVFLTQQPAGARLLLLTRGVADTRE